MEHTIIENDPVKAFNRIYQLEDRMQRLILLYFCFCHLNYREIAEELGVTNRTVFRMRKAALEALNGESITDEG